jgi:hypothetical protein
MLTDRQTGVVMPGGGSGWFTRGQRATKFDDVQYTRLNYRGQVTTGPGTVAVRIDYSLDWATFSPLVPVGPTFSTTAANLYTEWVAVDPVAIAYTGGEILLRTIAEGTPSCTFLLDYVLLMYR